MSKDIYTHSVYDELDNNQGIIGDTVDAFQKGFYDGVAGIGETFGVDSLKEWGEDNSEQQLGEMSLAGRQALNKEFVTRDQYGDIELGEAATDIRSWTMNIGQMLGMNADVLLGGGVAKLGRAAVTQVVKASRGYLIKKGVAAPLAKQAAEKAGETYALHRKAWNSTKDHVIEYGLPAHAVYGGMQASDVRAEVEALDDDEIFSMPYAQERYHTLKQAYPHVDEETIRKEARRLVADDAATNALLDPTLLTANMVFGGLSTKVLEKAARGKLGKIAAIGTETATEGVQESMQQFAKNQTMQDYKPNVESSDGVLEAGLTGAMLGGGTAAAVGGARTAVEKTLNMANHAEKNRPAPLSDPLSDIPVNQEPTDNSAPPVTDAPPVAETNQDTSRIDQAVSFLNALKDDKDSVYDELISSGVPKNTATKVTQIIRTYSPKRLKETRGELADSFIYNLLNSKSVKSSLKYQKDQDKINDIYQKIEATLKSRVPAITPVEKPQLDFDPDTGEIIQQPQAVEPSQQPAELFDPSQFVSQNPQANAAPQATEPSQQPAELFDPSQFVSPNPQANAAPQATEPSQQPANGMQDLTKGMQDLTNPQSPLPSQSNSAPEAILNLKNQRDLLRQKLASNPRFLFENSQDHTIEGRIIRAFKAAEIADPEYAKNAILKLADITEQQTNGELTADVADVERTAIVEQLESLGENSYQYMLNNAKLRGLPERGQVNAQQPADVMPTAEPSQQPANVMPAAEPSPQPANVMPAAEPSPQPANVMPAAEPALHIDDYSEKSLVIRGDTKRFKDNLKAAKFALYNGKLKGGAGWIVSKKHEEKARALVSELNASISPSEPEQNAPAAEPSQQPANVMPAAEQVESSEPEQNAPAAEQVESSEPEQNAPVAEQVESNESAQKEAGQVEENQPEITDKNTVENGEKTPSREPGITPGLEKEKPSKISTLNDWFLNNSLENVKNANDLKKIVADFFNLKSTKDVTPSMLKEAEEAYEAAEVITRRKQIQSLLNKGDISAAFEYAKNAYESQPALNTATNKSASLMAYSTPTPFSLLANLAAGIDADTVVYEPTAGNGLLLITPSPKNVIANELDPIRAEALAHSGYQVSVSDAVEHTLDTPVDSVLANPPFGRYRDADGHVADYQFTDDHGKEHTFKELDHIIAVSSLETMKNDGTASLILGAPKDATEYKGNNKVFLNWLYSNYNVKHHVELDGKLYAKQGAQWPTQFIVIDGRSDKPTGKYAPLRKNIKRLSTWDELYENAKSAGLLDTQGKYVDSGAKSNVDGVSRTSGQGKSQSGVRRAVNEANGTGRGNSADRSNGARGAAKTNRYDALPDSTPHFTGVGAIDDARYGELESSKETAAPKRNTNAASEQSDAGNVSRASATEQLEQNALQVPYESGSNNFNEGILTPTNMLAMTKKALQSLANKYGSVDDFVKDRLGYDSDAGYRKAFMGLQADAIALAVENIERGRALIIGDQTGVGKGRQAAGIMRYAMQQGKIPVFITQKANLFTDMYDDLADIGVDNFKPLIMNNDVGISKVDSKTGNTTVKYNLKPKERKELTRQLADKKALPDDYNALFLTYSQLSSDQTGAKKSIIHSIADKAVFVLDESHSAAGQGKLNKFMQESVITRADGVAYLSATYAKRADSLPLYQRTDLGLAFDNPDALADAINEGGVAMQAYIATKLVEAGQYVRREKSFEGIKILPEFLNDSDGSVRAGFDQVTDVLRDVQRLSAQWENYVKTEIAESNQEKSGTDTLIAGSQSHTKISVTLFSSIVHNYLDQLTLGLKAPLVADKAIELLKKGEERPVIALENTMGSAFNEFLEEAGLSIGDKVSNFDFSTILKTVLDGTFHYIEKDAGQKKGVKIRVAPDDILDPSIVSSYYATLDKIESLTASVPASPIDTIRQRIQDAGYSVAEITGRERMIDYSNGNKVINKPADEKVRRNVVDRFNNGDLDVLILNQAGSTGLSIHARSDYKDTRKRHMLVAQPSLNIDTFLQMLGRINRTGQVVKPEYTLVWLPLPSEMRPAAVISKKMSRISAQTSGNKDSVNNIESVDMLNEYGDHVVEQYIEANKPELNALDPNLTKLKESDQAEYFFGKLRVQDTAIQEHIVSDLTEQYNTYIDYLTSIGENKLDTQLVDLDAKPIAQKVLNEGSESGGVFNEPTYITEVDAKTVGKAPKWDEVAERLAESSQADFDKVIESGGTDTAYIRAAKARAASLRSELADYKAKGKETASLQEKLFTVEAQISDYENKQSLVEDAFSSGGMLSHGSRILVKTRQGKGKNESDITTVTGVVVGITHSHKTGKGSPYSPSKWKVRVMVADRSNSVELNLIGLSDGTVHSKDYRSLQTIQAHFDRVSTQAVRENIYIVTGGLLKAYDKLKNVDGRIAPFTTHDGKIIQGLIMRAGYNAEANIKVSTDATARQRAEWLMNTTDDDAVRMGLADRDMRVRLTRHGHQYTLQMPKAKNARFKSWGNPLIEAIIGEQAVKGGGLLKVTIPSNKVIELVEAFQTFNPLDFNGEVAAKDYLFESGQVEEGFSKSNIRFAKRAASPSKGLNKAQVSRGAAEFVKAFNGAAKVKVKVVNTQAELPNPPKNGVAQAEYQNGVIHLVAENIENNAELTQVLREEVIAHHGLNKVISKADYDNLIKRVSAPESQQGALKSQWQRVKQLYPDFTPEAQAEEVIGQLAWRKPSKVQLLINRIKNLLISALRRVGLISNRGISRAEVEGVLESIARSMKAGLDPDGGNNNGGKSFNSRKAQTGPEMLKPSSWVNNLGSALTNFKLSKVASSIKSMLEDKRHYLLALAPRRYIAEVAESLSAAAANFKRSLKLYNDRVAKMEASRNELIQRSQEVADQWRSLIGKDSKSADALARLMHDSTLEGVDPSTPTYVPAITEEQAHTFISEMKAAIKMRNNDPKFMARKLQGIKRIESKLKKEQDGSRERAYDLLRARYLQLPSSFHGKWVDKKPGQTYSPSVRRRGNQVWEQGVFEQARDAHRAQNIRRENAIVQRLNDLLGDDDASAVKRLIAEIKHDFEMNELEGIYFPLRRYGEYVGMVISQEGDLISYSMFESHNELKEWKKEATKSHPSARILADKRPQLNRQLDTINPKFMHGVMDKLNGLGSNTDAIRDDVYQLYLESLPDMSARKAQIHRKGVKGFSEDALRGFAHTMFHGAYNIARIENAHYLEMHLEEMRVDQKQAAELDTDEQYKMTDIVNEMQKRHEWIVNPQGGKTANMLTNFTFMWYLGLTPAAALLNVTQTPILALPILGAKYGFGNASKQLLSASKEFVKSGWHVDTHLKGWERIAFDDFLKSGLIDKTMTHDLSGLAEGGHEYSPRMHKFTSAVGFMFHHTERFNREVTALASYRMETARLKRTAPEMSEQDIHAHALDAAKEATYKAHFDYSNANKARFMQNDFVKVLMVFKQHSLNMTWRLALDLKKAIAGASPEDRKEARKQLTGILGITFLLGGATALPLFSSVMNVISLALDDEDEPFDAENEFRAFIAQNVSPDVAEVMFKGVANMATGADVSSRIALNNMWLRDAREGVEGEGMVNYFATQALGATYGIALSLGRSTSLLSEGKTDRAAEAALPKAMRDVLKAIRYHNEGVQSHRGDPVVEDTTLWEEVIQATGWTPHRVADQYSQNAAVKGYEVHIQNRRKLLLSRYALAVRLNDRDYKKEVLADMDAFNEANPTMAITAKNRASSIARRKALSEKAENGILRNQKLSEVGDSVKFLD